MGCRGGGRKDGSDFGKGEKEGFTVDSHESIFDAACFLP
jgi:hypothetical protein